MMMRKDQEPPVMGIPYAAATQMQMQQQQPQGQQYYYYAGVGGHEQNPYQDGVVPPNAIFGDPKGIPIQQTIFRDTPAPFNCLHCGHTALTTVRSKPSLAAVVGCMMPLMLGICFLCPSMDCLWHKYHYCPSCSQKVADFEKQDPCIVMDPPHWTEQSFALPA